MKGKERTATTTTATINISYCELKAAKTSACNITFNYTKHDINDTE
jgi:hypothetical protein